VGGHLIRNRPQGRRGSAISYVPCARTPHVVVERAAAFPYVQVKHTSCAITSIGTEGRLSSRRDASGTVKQCTQVCPESQSTWVRRISSARSYDKQYIEFRSQFESTWREVVFVSHPQFSASEMLLQRLPPSLWLAEVTDGCARWSPLSPSPPHPPCTRLYHPPLCLFASAQLRGSCSDPAHRLVRSITAVTAATISTAAAAAAGSAGADATAADGRFLRRRVSRVTQRPTIPIRHYHGPSCSRMSRAVEQAAATAAGAITSFACPSHGVSRFFLQPRRPPKAPADARAAWRGPRLRRQLLPPLPRVLPPAA